MSWRGGPGRTGSDGQRLNGADLVFYLGATSGPQRKVTRSSGNVLFELGETAKQIGFYSSGEISPHSVSGACQPHDPTMTITTLSETMG